MNEEALRLLVRRLSRGPLFADADLVPCAGTRQEVEALIPHRAPFLLVDTLTGRTHDGSGVRGSRYLDPADAVFAGHFPGHPVYPGVLQVEAVSQLGACLMGIGAPEGGSPGGIRAVKIHHARFLAEAPPGVRLTLFAQLVGDDSLTATVAGQVYDGETLISHCVMEAYLV